MSKFVWFGTKFVSPGTNLSGVTGASAGDSTHIDARHCWNTASNWRLEEASNTGGWSGGGSGDGYTADTSYVTTSNAPGAGDTVIFKTVRPNMPGASGEYWPQSECLFGGWSGGSGWVNAGSTNGTPPNITVEHDYFNTIGPMGYHPNPNSRFGIWVGPQASGIARGFRNGGLNLKAGNISIDSSYYREWAGGGAAYGGTASQVKLLGADTAVTGDFIAKGAGRYVIRCNYMYNVFVEGTVANWYNDTPPSSHNHGAGEGAMAFNYTGHISNLCRVSGHNMDQFTYTPKWGGITAVPRMDIAPRYLTNVAGAIQIKGAVTALNFYPTSDSVEVRDNIWEGWSPSTQGAKYVITSLGSNAAAGRGNFGTIKLYENNPFHQIAITGSGQDLNNYVSFNNGPLPGSTDTITDLEVEAGVFRTGNSGGYGLRGTLNIIDGVVQGGAYINLQDKNGNATIEIAGYSGGVAGDGIFVASPNANVILPSAGNIAFNTPSSGGASAAELGLAPSKG
jgi:hypothetical protein